MFRLLMLVLQPITCHLSHIMFVTFFLLFPDYSLVFHMSHIVSFPQIPFVELRRNVTAAFP
jgi:hypothetical protein